MYGMEAHRHHSVVVELGVRGEVVRLDVVQVHRFRHAYHNPSIASYLIFLAPDALHLIGNSASSIAADQVSRHMQLSSQGRGHAKPETGV